MNTNIFGNNGYSATVNGKTIQWGFNVKEEHGNVFTTKLANELLDAANREYKKGCPKGYKQDSYNPDEDFTYIKYDMTDYRDNGDGESMFPVGQKKIGVYDKTKNHLRIYIDGEPVYENKDGMICRDTVAMMDSDAEFLEWYENNKDKNYE